MFEFFREYPEAKWALGIVLICILLIGWAESKCKGRCSSSTPIFVYMH